MFLGSGRKGKYPKKAKKTKKKSKKGKKSKKDKSDPAEGPNAEKNAEIVKGAKNARQINLLCMLKQNNHIGC